MARHDLEFFPVNQGGEQFVLVRDHLGLSPEGTALGIPLYQFMTLLDGSHSITDLQTIFMRHQGGVFVGSDEINRLLESLDTTYLLDSKTFRSARDKIVSDFTKSPIRPASHSGKSYPDDSAQLKARLEEILAEATHASGGHEVPSAEIKALVAPHIDLNVGQKSYNMAYGMLLNKRVDRVVVLGTGHHLNEGLFSLTHKDFETPFGRIKSDRDAVKGLQKAGQGVLAPNDFVHRSEHSVEFQLIFLQRVLKNKDFKIIPILCGSPQLLDVHSRDVFLEKSGPFLQALRRILEDPGHETLLVAGVDFSHTGPKFGHQQTARALEKRFREHDQNLLGHLCHMNADLFWQESARVGDEYHVCGFSAMALLMEVVGNAKGKVLSYEIWHEDPTQSAVSFASVLFAETPPVSGS